MRPYSPGGTLNALAAALGGSIPPTPSVQRLRCGLPGYLIPFATHTFAHQRQEPSSWPPSPLVFFQISTHSTATPGIPPASPVLKSCSFQRPLPVEQWRFHARHTRPPTRPLRPMNPNNACPLRFTAAAGTELAGASSSGTVNPWFSTRAFPPDNRGLHTEVLHPPRGVARSGFPPLPKPLDCCLP